MNQRGNVAQKSVLKVNDAVQQLGYVRNVAAANLSRKRTHRLAFLIPRRSNVFFARMHEHIDMAALHLKFAQVSIDVIKVDAFELNALERAIQNLTQTHYDGIAIVGLNSKQLLKPLSALQARGTHIVSLVSDLPQSCRSHYVGIDNNKAGRSAARLTGMAHAGLAGRVLIAAGSLDASDHLDRLEGFRSVIEQDFPNIDVLDVIETGDQPTLMRQLMTDAWDKHDQISAIYNVGAGNEGLIDMLRTVERRQPFCCIVHELIEPTRRALEDGTIDVVIDQRPEIEVDRALTRLKALIDDTPAPPSPELIPAVYVRDNLPAEFI